MKKFYRIITKASGAVLILFVTLAAPVFAENEFSLFLAPAFEVSAGEERFGPGAGAAATLDWAFLPFAGLSARGGFSSLSTAAGSGFTLYRAV
jgi:hypothetical protein